MTTDTHDRPLLTLQVIAFQQERYIREAVAAAFAQTYQPLQIILSDDGSKDATYEIMAEMAAEYSGPHQIVLNRNEPNLGIGRHISRCAELATGELIISSAGDDVCLPQRVERLYEAWVGSNKTAMSIDSLYEMIDENGVPLSTPPPPPLAEGDQLDAFSRSLTANVVGACHAWHRSLFDRFGPLPAITLEDVALPPRAMLLGRVIRVQEVLVRYRTHSGSVWNSWRNDSTAEQVLRRRRFYATDRRRASEDVVRCIEQEMACADVERGRLLRRYISQIREQQRLLVLTEQMLSESRSQRWSAAGRYLREQRFRDTDRGLVAAALSRRAYAVGRMVGGVWRGLRAR